MASQFINSQLILNHLNQNNIPATLTGDRITTAIADIFPNTIISNISGEILLEINLNKKSPDFNDSYPEDLADGGILALLLKNHQQSMGRV